MAQEALSVERQREYIEKAVSFDMKKKELLFNLFLEIGLCKEDNEVMGSLIYSNTFESAWAIYEGADYSLQEWIINVIDTIRFFEK